MRTWVVRTPTKTFVKFIKFQQYFKTFMGYSIQFIISWFGTNLVPSGASLLATLLELEKMS